MAQATGGGLAQVEGSRVTRAAGPLAAAVGTVGGTVGVPGGAELGRDANACLVMRRLALVDTQGRMPDKGQQPLLVWASSTDLGQDVELLKPVWRRREAMLAELAGRRYAVRRLLASPHWRLVVGLGDRANPSEVGLSLHGTYGWPVIPGSTLKGATCAWAVANDKDAARIASIFGAPRPRPEDSDGASDSTGATDPDLSAARGTVSFLDALPAGAAVSVVRDVLTPHVQAYYRTTAPRSRDTPDPPGEWHNPVPVEFLAVASGSFAVDLVGRDEDDLREAAAWCRSAIDDIGVGAKTSSGYGYLEATEVGASGG